MFQCEGMSIQGHPTANFNGDYRPMPENEYKGWTVLKNQHDMFCARAYAAAAAAVPLLSHSIQR